MCKRYWGVEQTEVIWLLWLRAITGPNSNSMQYVEVEILGAVTLPLLPKTFVKKHRVRWTN